MKTTPRSMTAFLAVLVVAMVGANFLLWVLSPMGFEENALQQALAMLLAHSGDDSWGPMAIALEYLAAPGPKPLYSQIFFDGGVKFQYPPSALFGLLGLEALWPGHVRTSDGMTFAGWPSINDIVGWFFVAMSGAASASVLEIRLQELYDGEDWSKLRWLRVGLVLALTLTFFPIVIAFTLGQIQVWLNGIFALAVLCWVVKRPALCGALIGLMCLVKPHYGLFLIWAAIRGEWRLVASGLMIGGAGLVASIATFGLSHHIDYLSALAFMSERGEVFYANQSVNGLLNRLMVVWRPDLYGIDQFNATQFPPYSPWVYWPSLATSAALLLGAMLSARKADAACGFAIAAISITIASPITWEHHYGMLLPLYMLIFPATLRNPGHLFWLTASYVLVGVHIGVTRLLGASLLNVLQSYSLAGALFFLLNLYLRLPYRMLESLPKPLRFIGRSS